MSRRGYEIRVPHSLSPEQAQAVADFLAAAESLVELFEAPELRRYRCSYCANVYEAPENSDHRCGFPREGDRQAIADGWHTCDPDDRARLRAERKAEIAAGKEAAAAQLVVALAEWEAAIAAGDRVCHSLTSGGWPCSGSPIPGADVCHHHTDDDVRNARDAGKGAGTSLVDEETALEVFGDRPRLDVFLACYEDAYRRTEIENEFRDRRRALAAERNAKIAGTR